MSDGTFDPAFRTELLDLLQWRRDVRRFKTDEIPAGVIDELIEATRFSPSVGYSQPWRFVTVESPQRRQAVITSFERANAAALRAYEGIEAQAYAALKLSGLQEAPVHVAVFCDAKTQTGKGLGSRTMPQTLHYSTVMAIYTLWLVARAQGIGLGWVSILDPQEVTAALEVPSTWEFVAYLCIGYPLEQSTTPELRAAGWEIPDDRSRRAERR